MDTSLTIFVANMKTFSLLLFKRFMRLWHLENENLLLYRLIKKEKFKELG